MKINIEYNPTFGIIEISVDENSNLNLAITDKKLIMSRSALSLILKVMLFNGFISPKLLLGVLEEYNTKKEDLNDKER